MNKETLDSINRKTGPVVELLRNARFLVLGAAALAALAFA